MKRGWEVPERNGVCSWEKKHRSMINIHWVMFKPIDQKNTVWEGTQPPSHHTPVVLPFRRSGWILRVHNISSFFTHFKHKCPKQKKPKIPSASFIRDPSKNRTLQGWPGPRLDVFRTKTIWAVFKIPFVCHWILVSLVRDSPFLDDWNPQYMYIYIYTSIKGSIIPQLIINHQGFWRKKPLKFITEKWNQRERW